MKTDTQPYCRFSAGNHICEAGRENSIRIVTYLNFGNYEKENNFI